jgi:hypothetical protein
MSFRRWFAFPVLTQLHALGLSLYDLRQELRKNMATTQELVDIVNQIGPAIDAFEARITALVKNSTIPAADQANIDAAVAALRADLADAADGVDEADVPAAPPSDTPPAP